jgi:hypothetical protein
MCRLSPTSEVGPWGRYLCHPETRRPSVQTASIPQCTSSVTAPTRPNADTLTFGTMGRPDLTMNGAPSSAPMPRLLPTSPTPLSAQTTRISDGFQRQVSYSSTTLPPSPAYVSQSQVVCVQRLLLQDDVDDNIADLETLSMGTVINEHTKPGTFERIL